MTLPEALPALPPEAFAPAPPEGAGERIARPSLSYWQDAWRRFKRNRRALASLAILVLLALFTLAGPLVWRLDPAQQNLAQASQAPAWPKRALVVAPSAAFQAQAIPRLPAAVDEKQVVWLLGQATTQRVRIAWRPVAGAEGYNIYRHTRKPRDFADLGLPLGSAGAGQLAYEDRLGLKARDYHYAIVPTDGIDEFEHYELLHVQPRLAITAEAALARGLTPDGRAPAPGDEITLEFHPLGTDYLGRDLLARLMAGAQVSLFIGILAPLIFVLAGVVYGGFAGYFGGALDSLLMRFADFVVALPFLLFMILFKIAFGIGPGESGILPMLAALVLLGWPATARLVRGQVLQIREQGYIQAARLLGAGSSYLILRHILPNTLGVILVTLTFAVPTAIFTEAFLSFIGMGVAPPTPSWGSLCNEGVKTMLSHPHELVFPAAFISLTVLAFNLLGDGLTEALDARQRDRQ